MQTKELELAQIKHDIRKTFEDMDARQSSGKLAMDVYHILQGVKILSQKEPTYAHIIDNLGEVITKEVGACTGLSIELIKHIKNFEDHEKMISLKNTLINQTRWSISDLLR